MKGKLFCLLLALSWIWLGIACSDDPGSSKPQKPQKTKGTPTVPPKQEKKKIALELKVSDNNGQNISPDKVVVKEEERDAQKEFRLQEISKLQNPGLLPGKYHIAVYKKGYLPHVSQLDLKENQSLVIKLKVKPREIEFQGNVKWDELRVEDDIWNDEKKELVPGKYRVKAQKLGYQTYESNITVPVGEGPCSFMIRLKLKGRKFQVLMSHKVEAVIQLTALEGGKISTVKSGDEIIPGKYKLSFQGNGYKSYEQIIEVKPGIAPFIYKAVLESNRRRFYVKAVATGDGFQEFAIAEFTLNGATIKSGDEVSPGKYKLAFTKTGFLPIAESLIVPEEKGDFTHIVKLQYMPCAVKLAFQDEKNNPLQPEVTIDGKKYQEGMKMTPGKYQVSASLKGYHSVQHSITITVGQQEFTQKLMLESIPVGCEVEIMLKSGSLTIENENIVSVSLDGKLVKPGVIFAYGKHSLIAKAKGYKAIEKEIEIPQGEKKFLLTEEMEPISAKLIFRFIGSSGPIQPDKILVDGQEFKSGDVAPGIHEIVAQKAGYSPLREKIYINPSLPSQDFTWLMNILPRKVNLIFVDADSGDALTPVEVKLDGNYANYKSTIEIKPGPYNIEVITENYPRYEDNIKIEPGDDTLELTIKLKK